MFNTKKIVKDTSRRLNFFLNLSTTKPMIDMYEEYNYYINTPAKTPKGLNVGYEIAKALTDDPKLSTCVEQGAQNMDTFQWYQEQIAYAPKETSPEEIKDLRCIPSVYLKYEKKYINDWFQEQFYKVPIFHVVFDYDNPTKDIHSEIIYDAKELLLFKAEYDSKNRRKYEVKRERSLLTSGLRYDVMRRDGFRCVLCGRSATDGVKLHVDHIYPVSKGGKTEMSNLRTLCEECNLGKSNKIE